MRAFAGGEPFPFRATIEAMRFFRAALGALLVAGATAACSGSGDTGSSGGWHVSGAHIRIAGESKPCRTPSPVLDTFSSTPSPQPGCSPAVTSGIETSAGPSPQAHATAWQKPHTEDYRSATTQAWHPIYTTYTAPPGTGIYQPMVHATQQPMPTPFTTASPAPLRTSTPLPTVPPMPTQPPPLVQPSATP